MRDRVTVVDGSEWIGDIFADPSSQDWAIAARRELQSLLAKEDANHKNISCYMETLIRHRSYQLLAGPDGSRFLTFEAFCVCRPPCGLGRSKAEIDALVDERKRKETARQQAADKSVPPLNGRGNPTGTNQHKKEERLSDNVSSLRGTGSSYLVRRLKRDSPAIADALGRGEYPSARAAAIAAGIVKVDDRPNLARKAFLKLTPREREDFLAWVATQAVASPA